MTHNDSVPWLISGVLLVLVLVVGYLWLSTARELQSVLAENNQEIRSQRDVVAEACAGPKADREACNEALTELANILREFSADLSTAATTSVETQ